MRIPKVKGVIKRRLLVNFRASPEIVRRILPSPFRPKLHGGYSLVGICLIRLEHIRPIGLPVFLGISSENAAHRIAVEWNDADGILKEGVYIPRRDSGSWLNHLAGGRVFPGVHHAAKFSVIDSPPCVNLAMHSTDGKVHVNVIGRESCEFPSSSCFGSLQESSAFFKGGSLGYSVSRDASKSDGILLHTEDWIVRPLEVSMVSSSFFDDSDRFPAGSVHFDHALIMRDIAHEWHSTDDMTHDHTEPNP